MAALTATFFALHPLRSESVAWALAQTDVIYVCFFLLGLLAYFQYRTKNNYVFYGLALLCHLLSLLAKPSAVVFAVVLPLLDYLQDRKFDKSFIIDKIPFFLLSFAFGLLTVMVQKSALDMSADYNLIDRFFISQYALFFYIGKTFLPFKLNAFYSFPPKINGWLPLYFYLMPLLTVSVAWLIYKAKKFRKELIFTALFFIVNLALVLQFIPYGENMVAERYAYLPHIALWWAIFYIVPQTEMFKNFDSMFRMAAVFFLLLFVFITFQRNKVWENSLTLWSDSVQKTPDSYFANYALANTYQELKNYQEVVNYQNRAIEIRPQYPLTYINRGIAKYHLGDLQGAYADESKAVELAPKMEEAYTNRGIILTAMKQPKEAIADFNKAIAINPRNPISYRNRGINYYFLKQYAEGGKDMDIGLALSPNDANMYYYRGVMLFELQEMAEACKDWKIAAQLGHQEAFKQLKVFCK